MQANRSFLWFGRAASAAEFEQIFRLNHRTFAEEIPQHPPHGDGRLIDKFHAENDYLICKDNEDVVGMIALRARRPFSLDAKLADLDRYLPPDRSVCEIRLLAVCPGYRHSRVLPGLVRELARLCRERGHDYAVISGTTRQAKLYEHLGFTPFGPLTGKPGAYYQPMAITLERFCSRVSWLAWSDDALDAVSATPMCLTPGPAQVHPEVIAALATVPKPHRSRAVATTIEDCRRRLIGLTRADDVQILLGSGTLANDAIAQQLRLAGTTGVILANGEFGDRLIDHARRAGLAFLVCRAKRGTPFDYSAIRTRILKHGRPRWLWMAHCETSTGVLNDLAAFKALAREFAAEAVIDCVSSIGNVELDLTDVGYASGVSGKGLASLPGLAFVFHKRKALRSGPMVPRYLDLRLYAQSGSVPFTHSSNLLSALAAALHRFDPADFARRRTLSLAVRAAVKDRGFAIVDNGTSIAPFVVTIALPPHTPATELGTAMLARGYQISFESRYLKARNWVQIAWMGAADHADVLSAIDAMADARAEVGADARRAPIHVVPLAAVRQPRRIAPQGSAKPVRLAEARR